MRLNNWPAPERPREKLLARGVQALSDAELLALFLRSGTRGRNAVDLGRELLRGYNGLRRLLDSPQPELCATKGVGPVSYVLLQAALELGRRYLQESLQRSDALQNPKIVKEYLRSRLRSYEHEVFTCLFLDNRHRVISCDEMFHGTIDSASVHPREVVKRALQRNAAAVIFAHNHPSGVAEPSRSDCELTRRLQQALQLVEIRVLDHFVIGDTDTCSFAESGLL